MKKPQRDPRVDPKVGDGFMDYIGSIEVTEISGDGITYALRQPGPGPVYKIPVICTVTLERWRELMAKAVVVK